MSKSKRIQREQAVFGDAISHEGDYCFRERSTLLDLSVRRGRPPSVCTFRQFVTSQISGRAEYGYDIRGRRGEAARGVVPYPTKSTRIDIEIYFLSQGPLRPDIGNIVKPILDALKGVVYVDDSQVRSIKVAAFPSDEPFGITGPTGKEIIDRLFTLPPKEFLIDIHEGLMFDGGPS